MTVALATMLAPLNSTMIAVALPSIIDDFDTSMTSASWLITGYLIGMASLQPIAGKLGDRLGRKRVLQIGLLIFGLVSIAAAVAPNLWLLLVFRVGQAVAGALIAPNGAALIRDIVGIGRLGRGFGAIGGAVAVAAALGPLIGGVLIAFAGWRSIFFVNLLLVIPALLLSVRYIPKVDVALLRQGFDYVGAITLPIVLIGTAALLITSSRIAEWYIIAVVAIGLVLLAGAFLRRELQQDDPLFQPRFFRVREFAAANGGIAFGNMSMYTILLSVPILLSARSGSSSLQIGFVLAALSAAMIILAPMSGRLVDSFGRRLPTTIGLGVLALGALPLALGGTTMTMPMLIVGLGLVGLGLGLSTPGLQTSALESVESKDAGAAAGVYATSRYMGSIVGSALLAGLLGSDRANVDGIGTIFVLVLVSALIATVFGLGLRPRRGYAHVTISSG